jgi:ubiquinol-cytochrome c reductase cytochrome c subunit
VKRAAVVGLAAALVAAVPASAAPNGKALYGQYCVSCHGANGSGVAKARQIGGSSRRQQQVQPGVGPSLQGVGALAADFYLRTGYMPLQKVGLQPRRSRVLFSEPQIRALVRYVASLGKGPAIPHPRPERGNLSQGLSLFTEHCAGCHQVVAEGGLVTGALPPALENATATQIAEAVRIGPYVMPTFTKKAITDQQLNSIIAYVEYAKHPDDRGGWALGHIGPVPEGLVTWFIAAAALVALCMVIGKRLGSE